MKHSHQVVLIPVLFYFVFHRIGRLLEPSLTWPSVLLVHSWLLGLSQFSQLSPEAHPSVPFRGPLFLFLVAGHRFPESQVVPLFVLVEHSN